MFLTAWDLSIHFGDTPPRDAPLISVFFLSGIVPGRRVLKDTFSWESLSSGLDSKPKFKCLLKLLFVLFTFLWKHDPKDFTREGIPVMIYNKKISAGRQNFEITHTGTGEYSTIAVVKPAISSTARSIALPRPAVRFFCLQRDRLPPAR